MPKKKLSSPSKKTKKPIKKKVSVKPDKKRVSKKYFSRNRLIGFSFFILAFLIIVIPQNLPKPKPSEVNPIVINSDLLSSKKTQSNPVRILVPKVDIDLPIVDAKIVNGYWEISETSASYGLGSGHPGEKGNMVIFAHAREGFFYNLKNTKIDDIVYVFTKDKWHRYKVSKITQVYPDQIEVIKPTKDEVLTLYTCTGFNDEKRLIITALPQK